MSSTEEDRIRHVHLICPVCLELPDNEIFQCKNGHSICANCCARTKKCPQCRVPYREGKIRNRVMESILWPMKCHCPYKNNGCTEILRRKELPDHKINCVYNGKSIKFCKQLGFNCDFKMNTLDLSSATTDHLVGIHKFIHRTCSSVVKIRLENFVEDTLSRGTGVGGGSFQCQDTIWTPIILECTFSKDDDDDDELLSHPSDGEDEDSLPSDNDSKGLMEVITEKFLILCKYHEKDKSLSLWCSLIGSCKEIASNHEIMFRIKSCSEKAPDLVWTVPPSIILQADVTLPMSPFRIPVESLHKYYIDGDGGLVVNMIVLTPLGFKKISDDDGEWEIETIWAFKMSLRNPSQIEQNPPQQSVEVDGRFSEELMESVVNRIRDAVSGLNFD